MNVRNKAISRIHFVRNRQLKEFKSRKQWRYQKNRHFTGKERKKAAKR